MEEKQGMASGERTVTFRVFSGLDQSRDEELLDMDASPDCCNMSTEGGGLRVANGYRRFTKAALEGGIGSLGAFYRRADGKQWILAANAGGIWAYCGDKGYSEYDGDADVQEAVSDADAQSAAGAGGKADAAGTGVDGNSRGWVRIYTPPANSDGSAGSMGEQVDFLNYQDAESDVVLIADGKGPVLKWIGEGVAAAREGVPKAFGQLEVNYERVWGACAPGEPDTLYYSRQFNIGDWTSAGEKDDPDEAGGFIMIPTWNGGRVNALRTLFNDMVAFKDNDIYKVSGTYPGAYEVSRITGVVGPIAARTVVQHSTRVYFLGRDGLCVYDGLQAAALGDERAKGWFGRISEGYEKLACAIVHKQVMYIAMPVDGATHNNCVLEYDLRRSTFMPRTGIAAAHWLKFGEKLLFAGGDGYVYEYGAGHTYDGKPIRAWWETPLMNMVESRHGGSGDRAVKQLGEVMAYGVGRVHIMATADAKQKQAELKLGDGIKRAKRRINVRGRRFKLRLSNVDGLAFRIAGGLSVSVDVDED